MGIIGFIFIWHRFRKAAPHSKIYSMISRHCQWILERMEVSSGGEESDVLLHRAFPGSLNPEKSWFALPGSARQGFLTNTDKIAFDGLLGCDVLPAPASWFSAASVVEQKMFL